MPPSDEERLRWLEAVKARQVDSERSWWDTFWLSLALGWFGADRFYLGSYVLGLLKLFTFGGFGVWWLADLVLLLAEQIRDEEGRVLKRR